MSQTSSTFPVTFPRLASHLLSDMERLLQPGWGVGANNETGDFPINVEETEEAYIVTASLPGVADSQIDVTFDRDTLVISVSRPPEESKTARRYFIKERQLVTGTRSVRFPSATVAEDIQAEKKDGVLTIYLKKENSRVSKKVEIRSL